MAKISMRVILKSGVEFTTKCDKFTLTRNGLDQVTGYNISGITENKPVYLDFEQVAAIVRVLSDEDGEEAAEKKNGKDKVEDGSEELLVRELEKLLDGCRGIRSPQTERKR